MRVPSGKRLKLVLTAMAGFAVYASLGGRAAAQTRRVAPAAETVRVTAARPVARAMDAIEKRYGVLIDYVDPRYADAADMQIVRSVRGAPVGKPFPIPRVRTLSVQYTEVAGRPKGVPYLSCAGVESYCDPVPVTAWPSGGVTALIQRVLDQFASEGGQVFRVRKIEMSYGPRWEVYPEEVRDRSGSFSYQPDILAAAIFVPSQVQMSRGRETGRAQREMRVQNEERTARTALGSIYEQLEERWGDKFRVAGEPANPVGQPADVIGGQYLSAWKALGNFMGPTRVLRLLYAPDSGEYYSNIVRLPYRPPPRPPNPPAPKAVALGPRSLTPLDWLGMAHTARGIKYIQAALAKAGYLQTRPTGRWDADSSDAIRRFQLASGLPGTGELDGLTVLKLEPFLPKFQPPSQPNLNPLGSGLFYWLESTRRGQRDIQRALAEEGFYSGPLTGNAMDPKTRAALRAFQEANGLKATGLFDGPTSRGLAPLLLKMQN